MHEAMANAFISMIGFKSNKNLLELGLSEADYDELQSKILNIKNSANTNY